MPVSVKSLLECSDLCDKKSQNSGCFAFQYSAEKSGLCFLFEKPTDIIRHPNSEMDFYEQRRCQPNAGIVYCCSGSLLHERILLNRTSEMILHVF